jgi:hypothetical protein
MQDRFKSLQCHDQLSLNISILFGFAGLDIFRDMGYSYAFAPPDIF